MSAAVTLTRPEIRHIVHALTLAANNQAHYGDPKFHRRNQRIVSKLTKAYPIRTGRE